MAWSTLHFGKHTGKTLPQIIFADPDWFFWAWEENKLSGFTAKEAEELNQKARNIRIPQKDSKLKLVAEYYFYPQTRTFSHMKLIPISTPRHDGPSPTLRKNVIDLHTPRPTAKMDESGYADLISSIKYLYFGKKDARMTKKRCEDFFENSDNFVLPASS